MPQFSCCCKPVLQPGNWGNASKGLVRVLLQAQLGTSLGMYVLASIEILPFLELQGTCSSIEEPYRGSGCVWTFCTMRGWGTVACLARRIEGLGYVKNDFWQPSSTLKEVSKQAQSGSSWYCMAEGKGKIIISWEFWPNKRNRSLTMRINKHWYRTNIGGGIPVLRVFQDSVRQSLEQPGPNPVLTLFCSEVLTRDIPRSLPTWADGIHFTWHFSGINGTKALFYLCGAASER